MALDLDAIRRKLAGLNGGRTKKIKITDDQPRRFRLIAFPDNEGQPFKERMTYNFPKDWDILAPVQFGKPDPIDELIKKLRSREGKSEDQAKEDWLLAKKLFPKIKTHAIVVDRDDEASGPQIWAFSQSVTKRLYQIFLDEEYGDITDPNDGTDIKVLRTKADNGFREYTIDPARRESPLCKDQDKAKEWLDNLPSIDNMYKEKSYEELDQILAKFLSGDDSDSDDSQDLGTERGGSSGNDDTDDTRAGDDFEMGQTFEDLDDAFAQVTEDQD